MYIFILLFGRFSYSYYVFFYLFLNKDYCYNIFIYYFKYTLATEFVILHFYLILNEPSAVKLFLVVGINRSVYYI